MSTHNVKCWPGQFAAIATGEKKHEVRKFDRDYKEGDTLILHEWLPNYMIATGKRIEARISHITHPGTWGLPDDLGVLSIEIVSTHYQEKANNTGHVSNH